jgi:hypothetical protein
VVATPSCAGATFGTGGTVLNGQYVCARHQSSALPNAVTSTVLTIGGVSATFTSTTASASQTISFANPGTLTFSAAPINLVATASSGLPVALTSATPAVCGIVGNALSLRAAGTCTIRANQAGNGAYLPAPEVTQVFSILATVPAAPVIEAITPGNGQLAVVFSAPASNGGSALLSYAVTCGGIAASATGSPILVTGLANGTAVSCTVTAANAVGTSAASAAVVATPAADAPLTLIGVKSRKTHGTAGSYDLPLDTAPLIGGNVSVEPRFARPAHRIVFLFNNPVSAVGGATALDAAMAPLPAPYLSFAGSEVTVSLPTGAALDNRRATVVLAAVNGVLSPRVSLGFLPGDINGSRAVNASDLAAIKSRLGQTTRIDNFLLDIGASGTIDQAGLTAAKARSGKVLP